MKRILLCFVALGALFITGCEEGVTQMKSFKLPDGIVIRHYEVITEEGGRYQVFVAEKDDFRSTTSITPGKSTQIKVLVQPVGE